VDGGFAAGLGFGGGDGGGAEDFVEAGGGEGGGFGVEEGLAGRVDAVEGVEDGGEVLGFEEFGDLGEGQAVEVAEVERGDAGLEEGVEEAVGQARRCFRLRRVLGLGLSLGGGVAGAGCGGDGLHRRRSSCCCPPAADAAMALSLARGAGDWGRGR